MNKDMKLTLRRSGDRGLANHGWLKSRHTFSFADYYDPQHMGFRSLRVINEDHVAASAGFPTHPHRDMEIFSYVVHGSLQHEDSMGNGRILKPGQIQLMSAGGGVTHSEFNPSDQEQVHFLQIWIQPQKRGLTPSYTEWHPQPEHAQAGKVLVISPDGRENSAVIHQDAYVYRLKMEHTSKVSHTLERGRGAWLQLVKGDLAVNGMQLQAGDAISTQDAGNLEIQAESGVQALLFDLG